jgi:C4-dicarboxylate-specific signal transduction histidine kinase
LIHRNAKLAERIGQELLPRKYTDSLAAPIGRIIRQAEVLRAFGSLTLTQIASDKRRTGRVDVHRVISNVLEMFKPFADDRHVAVTCEFEASSPYLRASDAALESIITNLLANSLRAFEQSTTRDRKILVRTHVEKETLQIEMLDSGPGIRDLNIKDIWLPGETTYPNGTGLGLTIVRDTAKDLGGSVDAAAVGELGGAQIIIELPILGA